MKYQHEQTESKLGFDQIRDLLALRASTEDGKALCMRMKPFRSPGGVEVELTRVSECQELLQFDEPFYFEVTTGMGALLDEAEIGGNWLRALELHRLIKWLAMVRDLVSYFKSRKEKYPTLYRNVERTEWRKDLLVKLKRILDDRGNLRDDASPELKRLRRERMRQSSDLRRQLQSILRNAAQNGWAEAAEITIRNDRYVIPLLADFKGRVKGFVHDVSQSGRTIFVEPSSVLDQNNRIRELFIEENNEIVRILTEATAWVKEEVPALRDHAKTVARLDFIKAKAQMAIDTQSNKPRFNAKGKVGRIVLGRHPLLILKEGMTFAQVVPLSLEMNQDARIILISGPNAGGKSVSLKTVGLLQLMVQSGMLVPCDKESEFRWYEQIFLDIGDEQSLQSDLSTYTSHLANMRLMLAELDKGSLFLMDEFGSGTDPKLGGAMAEAFLEKFLQSGAFGIITTHYGNLKNFADVKAGIVNAAMQFDPNTLTPTYHIEMGVPGRSYAFEIAKNVGIPESLLERAKGKIDGEQVYSEELLLKLEAQKAELEKVLKEQKERNAELKTWLERNQAMNKHIKQQENRILRDAHDKAQALIDAANAKIEHTIREIREEQASREKTRTLRQELREMLPEPPPPEPDEIPVVSEEEKKEEELEVMPGAEIRVGDWVKMVDSASMGQVIDLQGKRAVVTVGDLRLTVKVKQLVRLKKAKAQKGIAVPASLGSRIARRANATSELRVKGFRVEQALPVVGKFIDDALVAGMKEVRILHGKGTGALRAAIREYLSAVPEVIRMKDAPIDAGGAGWTVVSLN